MSKLALKGVDDTHFDSPVRRRRGSFSPDRSAFVARRCNERSGPPEFAMATVFGMPALVSAPPLVTAGQAFGRVFNLKNVAIVFYFCLLFLLSRHILALSYEDLASVGFSLARSLRQTLITGLLLLFTIAVVEAVVAARSLPSRWALGLGLLGAMTAAAVSIPLRQLMFGLALAQIPNEWSHWLSVWLLWSAIGFLGYWLFNSVREDQLARGRLADAECRRQALQAQMVEARLSALQAQIEPHFLFNTLANVKRLYETLPHQGREMLGSLISYLRAALPSMRQSGSTLSRELELANSFLTILKMRMGERLDFSINSDQALVQAAVPPMVLPTLVENAIKHGLSPLPEGGRIDITARREADDLIIEVRDNGAGFSAAGGSGVGLANTRSRLAALYGGRASLSLCSVEPRGVAALVRLPLQQEVTI
jgi:sensor histidine kinase YesM